MWDILFYIAIGFGGFVAGIIFIVLFVHIAFVTGRCGNFLPW